MCKEAFASRTAGTTYQSMLENIMTRLIRNNVNIVKYDINFTSEQLKANQSGMFSVSDAHVLMLDFLVVQKLMICGCIKYFE